MCRKSKIWIEDYSSFTLASDRSISKIYPISKCLCKRAAKIPPSYLRSEVLTYFGRNRPFARGESHPTRICRENTVEGLVGRDAVFCGVLPSVRGNGEHSATIFVFHPWGLQGKAWMAIEKFKAWDQWACRPSSAKNNFSCCNEVPPRERYGGRATRCKHSV